MISPFLRNLPKGVMRWSHSYNKQHNKFLFSALQKSYIWAFARPKTIFTKSWHCDNRHFCNVRSVRSDTVLSLRSSVPSRSKIIIFTEDMDISFLFGVTSVLYGHTPLGSNIGQLRCSYVASVELLREYVVWEYMGSSLAQILSGVKKFFIMFEPFHNLLQCIYSK